jgi:cell division protein FtsQ
VIKQSSNRDRSQDWEDEASTETRFRRVQAGVSPNGRNLPGMPLAMPDEEVDDPSRPDAGRVDWGRVGGGFPYSTEQLAAVRGGGYKDDRSGRWWRPSSRWGRALLTLCTLIVLGGLVTAFYVFKTYLERDSRFRIAGSANIEAFGLTQVSRAEMLPVFGEDIGRNIFFVPLAARRKQLEQIPWVERATVMRLLPDQIRVSVVERQPVAFVRDGDHVGLVDANGVLLTMPAPLMAQHHYSFPVVTGIDPQDPAPARKGRMAVYARLLAELDGGNRHFSSQISEIDLKDPEDAQVLMPEQGNDILAHFGEDNFLERYQRFQTHIGEWMQQYPKLASVDLRYDQQVVLEMAPGAGPATTAPDNPAAPAAARPAKDTAKPTAAIKKPEPSQKAAVQKPKTAVQKALTAKAKAAREKAVRDKKRRAGATRAALDLSRQKKTHPSAAARRLQ